MGQNVINSDYIITRLREKKDIPDEKRKELLSLLGNGACYSNQIMQHPSECIRFIVAMGGEKILLESLEQVEYWGSKNQPVSLFRVLQYLLDKYLDEQYIDD